MKPLLSDAQLAAIQMVGRSAMKVRVVVKRPVFTSGVLGDDETDVNPAVVSQPSSVLINGALLGYLRQTGGDTTGGIDVAGIQTTHTYELGLPIGTDVAIRDRVEIGGKTYAVQEVLDDESWPAMLNCVLRLGS